MHENKGMKLFSKADLIEAAKKGEQWALNARLELADVEALPDGYYPISKVTPHSRRVGQQCELHQRCLLLLNEKLVTVDVPNDFYNALPDMHGNPPPLPQDERKQRSKIFWDELSNWAVIYAGICMLVGVVGMVWGCFSAPP